MLALTASGRKNRLYVGWREKKTLAGDHKAFLRAKRDLLRTRSFNRHILRKRDDILSHGHPWSVELDELDGSGCRISVCAHALLSSPEYLRTSTPVQTFSTWSALTYSLANVLASVALRS